MLYLIGIILTLFLAFILISKKNKSTADGILAAWLVTIGIHLTLYYLNFTHKNIELPYLLGIELPMPLMHGPFLYLYTASLTHQSTVKRINIMHFIPMFISYLSCIEFYLLTNDQKIVVYQNEGLGFETITTISTIAVMVSGIFYMILSLKLLRNYQKTILNQFSYTEKINLQWLRYVIFCNGIIWSMVILGNDTFVYAAVVLFVIFVGYFGIKQVGVFTNPYLISNDLRLNKPTEFEQPPIVEQTILDFFMENTIGTPSYSLMKTNTNRTTQSETDDIDTMDAPKTIKYEKSGLSVEAAENIFENLTFAINKEKYFTNPVLSLTELAQHLQVHPNNLSQVINTFEDKNFFDFINDKRVEEFKKRMGLPENQQFTLLSIAYDCGFNSKTAFNRNFKKATGLSPSEYLKENKVNLN